MSNSEFLNNTFGQNLLSYPVGCNILFNANDTPLKGLVVEASMCGTGMCYHVKVDETYFEVNQIEILGMTQEPNEESMDEVRRIMLDILRGG